MPENNEPSEMMEFESALRSLQPVTAKLDRDAVMFRSGQAAARRKHWRLPAVAVAIGLVIGAAVSGFGVRATIQPETRIEYVERKGKEPAPRSKKRPEKNDSKSQESPPVHVVRIADSAPGQGRPSLDARSYVGLRNQVVRWGADVIPSSNSGAGDETSSAQPLRQMYHDIAPARNENTESPWLGISAWGISPIPFN